MSQSSVFESLDSGSSESESAESESSESGPSDFGCSDSESRDSGARASATLGAPSAETHLDGAAVIGLGAVTAFGWTSADLRRGLATGTTTVREPVEFSTAGHRTALASEVSAGPEPSVALGDRVGWNRLSRADQFAVVAAREAWAASTVADWVDPCRVGVFFGGSTAAMAEAEGFFGQTLKNDGPRPRLRSLESQQLNGPGDAVARELGVSGPVVSMSSACASGALAIEAALEALRSGEVDVAVAGGSDSLCQMTYAGFNALRAVDPERSRPFRVERSGLNLGEGAGVLVLVRAESLKQNRDSVVAPMAWLRGAGGSCDAHHMTAPHPEGAGAAASMRAALRDGGLEPLAASFVNAHGTGTPHNDSAEAAAIADVFEDGLPVTSVKGAIGHLLGAAGAVEAVATVLALSDGAVQPTAETKGTRTEIQQTGTLEPGVDLVLGAPRVLPAGADRVGVSNSFAFGGANASLVFSTSPVCGPTL